MKYCPEIKEECKGRKCACYMIDREAGVPFCTKLGVHFNDDGEEDAPEGFYTDENTTGVISWQRLLKNPRS